MPKPLRLAFIGTPDFALPTLRALLDAGHEVVRVYSQPPSKSGRGHKESASPVQQEAERRGIEVAVPESLKDARVQEEFAALNLDAAVVVAFGQILPRAILETPRLGCLNVHASLLPRWRGAAPIQRAILAGDSASGVTVMQMDEGLDTGAILLQERVEIDADADAGTLHDTLAELGGKLIVPALEGSDKGEITLRPQDEAWAIYAEKLAPEDRRIRWSRPAIEIERLIRAFAPRPGATAKLPDGETLKILRAKVAPAAPSGTAPGTVVDETSFTVSCGLGCLTLRKVQRAGKSEMDVEAFLRGYPLERNSRLG